MAKSLNWASCQLEEWTMGKRSSLFTAATVGLIHKVIECLTFRCSLYKRKDSTFFIVAGGHDGASKLSSTEVQKSHFCKIYLKHPVTLTMIGPPGVGPRKRNLEMWRRPGNQKARGELQRMMQMYFKPSVVLHHWPITRCSSPGAPGQHRRWCFGNRGNGLGPTWLCGAGLW